ncbi:YdcF family protein [Caldimonas aquatica]|uniref:YdcF family protein n=1 Tax=Caldimonas aquatica TaxID=376175 RepID=A0ABY6MW05_9BURK|nr:YdcF family protein [Schlegelella aquatica]UZD56198.1 YdcF family protein [Schlegelella aquatica]
MRLFFTSASEIPLPGAVYLVLILVILAIGSRLADGSRLYRWRHLLLALAAWSWILSTPALGNLVVRQLENAVPRSAHRPQADPRSVIVVLASGEIAGTAAAPHTRLDADGWERVHAAVSLWRRTGGRLLMAGGPKGIPPAESFAARMAAVAVSMGVPEQAIVLSPDTSRTHEDLLWARKRLGDHEGPIWLVTSALHMPRSLAVARSLDWDVRPWPCGFRQIERPTWRAWLPNNGGPQLLAQALHEVLGLAYYRWQGWAD